MPRYTKAGYLTAVSTLIIGLICGGVSSHTDVLASIPPTNSSEYVSDQGYAITPPDGWTMQKMANGHVHFLAPAIDGISDNIVIAVYKTAPSDSLEALPSAVARLYPKQFPQYQKLGDGFITVGGQKAYVLSATRKMDHQDYLIYFRQMFVNANGSNYILTGTSIPSRKTLTDPKLVRCFSTFHLTIQTTPSPAE